MGIANISSVFATNLLFDHSFVFEYYVNLLKEISVIRVVVSLMGRNCKCRR